jgi:hypothetical protein
MRTYIVAFLFAALMVKSVGVMGQSLDIIDPGPQPPSTSFDLTITNARDASNNLRNGTFRVEVDGKEENEEFSEELFDASVTFVDGEVTVQIEIPYEGVWYTRIRVATHTPSAKYIYLTTDLSTFTFTPPGTQTAGTAFNLSISGAKDYYNVDLTGDHLVTVTSDNTSEGTSGVLISNTNFTFSAGAPTTAPQITLYDAGSQTLTVTIAGITDPETGGVTVNAGAASKLVITQEPTNVTGNYDDSPVTLSTITLQTEDAWGNTSVSGFSGTQNVTATILNNPGSASLGGTTTVDIQSGTASFTALTIDEEGNGYTLQFTSTSPVSLTSATTTGFNVTQLNNISEFTISSPAASSTQYQNVDFQMQLTGAKNNQGADLTGSRNVTITSSSEGVVYNSNVTFLAGSASLTMALGNLGAHTLSVSVAGVDEPETLNIEVDGDESGFTFNNPGTPQYDEIPFNISLTGATGYDGDALNGNINVQVTSSISGSVYNANANFSNGAANFNITLSAIGIHNLTVSVAGITDSKTVTGIVVDGDDSDFSLSGDASADAGTNFDLDITSALDISGTSLSGSINVLVVSNLSGTVFNQASTFTTGSTTLNFNLTQAGSHTLTVSITGVTPTKNHNITINPLAASKLTITQQPSGGSGSNNNSAVNIGTVIVQIQDTYGNLISSTASISAALVTNPAGAVLSGTTAVNASGGIATFSNLRVNKDGDYTIGFSSTGLTGATSVEFPMTNVQDQSDFNLLDPGPQVVDVQFYLQITNAVGPSGALLSGSHSVYISILPSTILYNSTATFTNGSAQIPVTITSEYPPPTGCTIYASINTAAEQYLTAIVTDDLSDMDLVTPGTQTAGVSFTFYINDARDATGAFLTTSRHVTITSSNTSEGTGGVVFNGNLSFDADGDASTDIALTHASSQTLTVDIDWVKTPESTGSFTVNPNTVTQLVITQQPSASVNGDNDNVAKAIGTVNLETRDAHGNLSIVGLTGTTTLGAALTVPGSATLGGTVTGIDISDGTASFTDLTINKNGNYTLTFTYEGTSPTLSVVSNTISMTNIENLSGFDVVPEAGTLYAGYEFDLLITNAQLPNGTALGGSINVTVTSDIDGSVYSAATVFISGSATVPLTLTANTHDLTITVTGITNPETITDLVIAADQSDMSLALDPSGGPFYTFEPFTLEITSAKGLNGVNLSGSYTVTVTSDISGDGQIYNASTTFTGGATDIILTLETVANPHTLTVSIQGITNDETIQVNAQDNVSGFDLALEVTGDKTAGSSFNLSITNAKSISDAVLVGSFNVLVTSSNTLEGTGGVVYNTTATFTSGAALIPVILTRAGNQTLTVDIEDITPNEQQLVNVVAAIPFKLLITQQPTGGTGTGNDAAASIGGNISVGTFDTYNNPSAPTGGDMTVTAAIANDASPLDNAVLGGTVTLDISSGSATFSNLTLNQDGTGYTLSFTYTGTESISSATTSAFNMQGVNAYTIALTDESDEALDEENPLVFDTEVFGYSSITAENITITRTGGGVITTLAAALSGTQASSFTLTQPVDATLDGTPNTTTFTVKPNDDLVAGTYTALVTVTADNGVSVAFDVNFEVLAPYEISLDAPDPLVFAQQTEGYSEFSNTTVIITNVGGGTITGLSVDKSGSNPEAFVTSSPLSTSIAPEATTSFTIRPANSLTPGTYSATITVNNTESVPESFDVSFTVIAYTYTISRDPSGDVDFGYAVQGYNPAPDAETITITRTGTGVIANLATSISGGVSSDFDLTQPLDTELDGDPNVTTFTVRPKTGLTPGTYSETVTIEADNMTDVTFTVTFLVSGVYTWEGSSSTDWHTAANWNPNAVPDQYSEIIIPDTDNDPVISSVNVTVNELTIESGALLTVNSARRLTINNGGVLTIEPLGRLTNSGTLVNNAGTGGILILSDATGSGSLIQASSGIQATFERYMTPNTWHTLSSPVSGSIQSFIQNTNNNIPYNGTSGIYGMGQYSESDGKWIYYTNATYNTSFTAAKGYITRKEAGSDGLVTLPGTLNHGDIGISFAGERNGWNGIGNPYPSYIAFNQSAGSTNFVTANASVFESSYAAGYFWDGDEYIIVNNATAALMLQPGQGFVVKVNTTSGGTFNFTTAMQGHSSSSTFYKKSYFPWSKLKLQASSGTDSASTLMLFRGDMTTGVDVTYDAGLLGGNENYLLYSKLPEDNGVNFAIQCLPDQETENMVVPLGFNSSKTGPVTFKAAEANLPSGYVAMLEDKVTGQFTNLNLAGANYQVTLDAPVAGTGRFFLHLVAGANNVSPQEGYDLHTFSKGKEIHIRGNLGEDAKASVYDLMGRKITEFVLTDPHYNILPVNAINGVYVVKILNEGRITTEKVFLGDY